MPNQYCLKFIANEFLEPVQNLAVGSYYVNPGTDVIWLKVANTLSVLPGSSVHVDNSQHLMVAKLSHAPLEGRQTC